jgi:hypothetical protein
MWISSEGRRSYARNVEMSTNGRPGPSDRHLTYVSVQATFTLLLFKLCSLLEKSWVSQPTVPVTSGAYEPTGSGRGCPLAGGVRR